MTYFRFALAVLCFAHGAVFAALDKPNIVLILSDDQSWTDYSFMGHDTIQTPRLDRLAGESATFKRGYVPTALCRPSLMTLATGLYSHQHRTSGNDPADTPANAAHAKKTGKDPKELLISHVDDIPTLPQLLGEAGYLSHQSGKWWEGSYQRGGFTHGMTRGYPKPRGRHGDDGLKIGREGMKPIFDFIDMAVEEEKPFLIWYAAFMPHTPHTPPARLFNKYKKKGMTDSVAKYYAMCEWWDETCGQLVDRIEDKGLRENTLIVYVCDNGWIQLQDRNGYAPKSKRSPYDMGARTPIMYSWPGVINEASRSELSSSIDIVPTMLAAAGVDAPKGLPGLNLMPQLKSGNKIRRDTLFGESFAHDIANINKPEDSLLYRWVIEDEWKLLLTYDGRPGKMKYLPDETALRLFNLIKDPHEKNDLAAENPKLVKRLANKIDGWWKVTERKTVGM
ncbi:MAG: sulfatase [Opitutales bacterium]